MMAISRVCVCAFPASFPLLSPLQLIKAISTFPGDVTSAPLRELGTWLANLGYDVSIRSAVGGGEGAECFRRLRHRFLVVTLGDGSRYFVERDFPAHFALAHPSARLRALLAALPQTVAARPERFEALLDLAAAEMARSFRRDARGARPLPPWRSLKGLRGKWFPERPVDEFVRPEPSAFGARGGEAAAEVARLLRCPEGCAMESLRGADSSDSVASVEVSCDSSSDAECPTRVAGFGGDAKVRGSTPPSVLGAAARQATTRGIAFPAGGVDEAGEGFAVVAGAVGAANATAFNAAAAAQPPSGTAATGSSGRHRAVARAAWGALARAPVGKEARRVSLLARAMVPLRGAEEPCVRTVRLKGAPVRAA